VDDVVLIATSAQELQDLIDACQAWCERSLMQINTDKTKIMVYYETLRSSRTPATFFVTSRFPLSRPTQTYLKEPDTFIYLGIKLDPASSQHGPGDTTHQDKNQLGIPHHRSSSAQYTICSSHRSRTTRSSPLVLFRIWQACVLLFATQNLPYLRTPTQLQRIQTALTNSLQRIVRSYTIAEIFLLKFGVPPLRLQQACQLSLHYR